MILGLLACGPHLPPGPVSAVDEQATSPVRREPPASAEEGVWTVIVATGSDADPPGREGTAWAVAHAVGGDLDVTVGPTETRFVARCAPDGARLRNSCFSTPSYRP